MPLSCANPSCFAKPDKGALCFSCAVKRDVLFLIGISLGGTAVIVAIVRFF